MLRGNDSPISLLLAPQRAMFCVTSNYAGGGGRGRRCLTVDRITTLPFLPLPYLPLLPQPTHPLPSHPRPFSHQLSLIASILLHLQFLDIPPALQLNHQEGHCKCSAG
jgi:hypothetical protein